MGAMGINPVAPFFCLNLDEQDGRICWILCYWVVLKFGCFALAWVISSRAARFAVWPLPPSPLFGNPEQLNSYHESGVDIIFQKKDLPGALLREAWEVLLTLFLN